MSNSVRPHRRQPTRLPCPWDSPDKNTGVGCHRLLLCTCVHHVSSFLLPVECAHCAEWSSWRETEILRWCKKNSDVGQWWTGPKWRIHAGLPRRLPELGPSTERKQKQDYFPMVEEGLDDHRQSTSRQHRDTDGWVAVLLQRGFINSSLNSNGDPYSLQRFTPSLPPTSRCWCERRLNLGGKL